MAEQTLIQNLITRLGQSQDQRLPAELGADFVLVDERSGVDLLAQARDLAVTLRHYSSDPDSASGDWSGFFPAGDDAALLARDDGSVPPHLGLLASFYALYGLPQAAINSVTGRHRDFQFQRVLGFTPKPAEPDHAHLVLELKKNTAAFAVTPEHRFSAGKDATGVPLYYQPVRETVVGRGKVASLCSVYQNETGVRFAPIANSSDGLGGALDAAQPSWSAFGHGDLQAAPIGFALASPVLAMAEGKRSVAVDLSFTASNGIEGEELAAAFSAYLSGAKGWLGPYPLSGTLSDNLLTLEFSLAESDAAVVAYDAALHGLALAATAPVLQIVINPEHAERYADYATLQVASVTVRVTVDGLTSLQLENDHGSLNPKKAFQPFGPQPVVGSRFLIGCTEALSKNLSDLNIRLLWQGAPTDLADHYDGYAHQRRMNSGVSANLVYQDRSGQTRQSSLDLMDRDSSGASTLSPNTPAPAAAKIGSDARLFGLLSGGSALARWIGQRFQLARPMYQRATVPPPAVSSGYVTVALAEDFLHADYRKESVQHAVDQDKVVLNEPWTPSVQSISLGYSATSDTADLQDASVECYTDADVQFFHLGAFGQRREHAFLRQQYDYVTDKAVSLLPAYPDEGEFLIGLTGVAGGDALSLLLQVAEGSGDPEATAQTVSWSVLCDNYWRPLDSGEISLDSSNALKTSGLLALALPTATTSDNTWMPTGQVWLKGSIPSDSEGACQLLAVQANAVEVSFADQGNDPGHLASALAAGSITKMVAAPAALKSVSQPYASYGGRLQEDDASLARRAAERLRHRQRAVTAWDYERILLEAFPTVHQVKCIPHASDTSWLAPGNVMIVVIPDLRNSNAVDPLQPKVDLDTLTRMAETVQSLAGPQVTLRVKNPSYQPVRLDFKVRFHAGYAFNYYREQLHQALIEVLSPWAFDSSRRLDFGGRLYRSVLLDFVEELPYVDFVSDFRFGLAGEGTALVADVADLAADRPDAILVSDAAHNIAEITD